LEWDTYELNDDEEKPIDANFNDAINYTYTLEWQEEGKAPHTETLKQYVVNANGKYKDEEGHLYTGEDLEKLTESFIVEGKGQGGDPIERMILLKGEIPAGSIVTITASGNVLTTNSHVIELVKVENQAIWNVDETDMVFASPDDNNVNKPEVEPEYPQTFPTNGGRHVTTYKIRIPDALTMGDDMIAKSQLLAFLRFKDGNDIKVPYILTYD
jgi:hypothetical protein